MYNLNINAEVYASSDVVVIGGGPSGIAAAIAARRCGKNVTLVEKTGQLGGMCTYGNVSIFMSVGNITGLFKEMVCELWPNLKDPNPKEFHQQFNPFILRHYFNQKLEQENVQVIYHADFIKSIMEGSKVTAIAINTREGIKIIEGKVFIDCTGDARAAIDAGAKYTAGRDEDGMTQPMTLMFQMQNTGAPVEQYLPDGCYRYEEISELPQGRLLYWERMGDGTLLVNMTRVRGNGAKIEDINYAEKEALRQALSVANYLQRKSHPTYILSSIGAQTGVRESNQICGLYTLNEDDLINSRKFDDVVAQTDYEIDIHSPDGKKTCHERRLEGYDIPYGCMVPKNIEGILVSGRAISATHVAMSSLRVQITCFALGHAAGVAAAIACDDNCKLSDISIKKLHSIMKEQGTEFEGHG